MGKNREEITSPQFTKQIGTTTYVVNVHFQDGENAPTIEDRLLRLMEHFAISTDTDDSSTGLKMGA
ncbi:transposon-encoded TnpW family protein [Mediterraneibacter gnavus]|uniref:transposon-encoded TnpW family protein n=1 Tax=Mediterraneibacter gnavus TaxID=33038 RepID=UPI0011847C02|nr:transposon-encoded TnpW family protein [Mediterraneibacter gnavus]